MRPAGQLLRQNALSAFPSIRTNPWGKWGAGRTNKGHRAIGVSFLFSFRRCSLVKRTIIIFSILFTTALVLTTITNLYFIHPPDSHYLGNSSSHIFHTMECSYGDKIKEENRVYFNSIAEALAQKYRPCKVCNPK